MFRILLVEDNNLVREMLSLRLKRKGYSVLTAEDGIRGVALASTERPDLILMDISLPELDGWAAARMLKGTPITAFIPIIALTAHDVECIRNKARAADFDCCDTKPIDFERLLGKMQVLLRTDGARKPVD